MKYINNLCSISISIGLILSFCSSAWSAVRLSTGTIEVRVNEKVVPMADYYSHYTAVMAGSPSDKERCEKTQNVPKGVTVFKYAGDAGAAYCKGNYKSISFEPLKGYPPFTIGISNSAIPGTGGQYSCHATIKLDINDDGVITSSSEISSGDGCHVDFGK